MTLPLTPRLRPFKPQPFGRYTLLMPLATGGMGEIFLARLQGAEGFEKLCVIKKVLPHLAEDREFTTRFINEARTLVKLSHGAIAQVVELGSEGGSPFLSLEFVDGKDLRRVLARRREQNAPVPISFVVHVMIRVLDALAYAHRKRGDDGKEIGLVHRDVSPQNILISYEGEVKVIDFGLAKSTLNVARTNPSIVLGKFLYMSPEQARHAPVDRRSDLYSVGLCLYELLTGKNPFEGVSPTELMNTVSNPKIPQLQQVEPMVPPTVANAVMKALEVEPSRRFQTAEEMRTRLSQALQEIDPSAGPESASRLMLEWFAADYEHERKLFQQLRDTVVTRPMEVTHPVTALPRRAGFSNDATPMPSAPQSINPFENEKTATDAPIVAPPSPALSFVPTARRITTEYDRALHEHETMPGIQVDPSLLDPELPPAPAPVRVPLPQPHRRSPWADPEPVTAQAVIVLPDDAFPGPPPELPRGSVHELDKTSPTGVALKPGPGQQLEPVLSGLTPVPPPKPRPSPPPAPPPAPPQVSAGPLLVPAPSSLPTAPAKIMATWAHANVVVSDELEILSTSVRPPPRVTDRPPDAPRPKPPVVSPLPRALETGTGPTAERTTSNRPALLPVLLVLLALIAVVAVIGYDTWKSQIENSEDQSSPPRNPGSDTRRREPDNKVPEAQDLVHESEKKVDPAQPIETP